MTEKPNVLFIISDQHNAKALGHKNHPDVRTANLDRLAAEGVRFDTCIAQNPICTPSRVCFFSGQYPHNTGRFGNEGPNPAGLPNILGHFRRFGYRTGAIGKIHCPEYWIEDASDYFRELYWDCSIGGAPEYEAYLREKGLTGLRDDECLQEFGPRGMQSREGRVSNLKYEDSAEGWTVRETIGFMERAVAANQPFIVQASLPRPHQCYTPSEPFWSLYDESRISLPPNYDYEMSQKAPHLRQRNADERKGDWTLFEPQTWEAGLRRKLHGYLGCVSQVDHAVGELLDWLEKTGLAENTVVIYTSDHGDYACEHGLSEKAPGICSDAITRVPFIWRWADRFKAGHLAEEIVETVDLSATLCALAGLEAMETSDGKDISHLLSGKSGEVHKIGVTEFAWSKSVRKGKFRYVHYLREMFTQEYPQGFGELYHLEADPWEMDNLYFNPEYSELVSELRQDLLEWLVTTNRPVTVQGVGVASSTYQSVIRYHNSVNLDGKINPKRIQRAANKAYL